MHSCHQEQQATDSYWSDDLLIQQLVIFDPTLKYGALFKLTAIFSKIYPCTRYLQSENKCETAYECMEFRLSWTKYLECSNGGKGVPRADKS